MSFRNRIASLFIFNGFLSIRLTLTCSLEKADATFPYQDLQVPKHVSDDRLSFRNECRFKTENKNIGVIQNKIKISSLRNFNSRQRIHKRYGMRRSRIGLIKLENILVISKYFKLKSFSFSLMYTVFV